MLMQNFGEQTRCILGDVQMETAQFAMSSSMGRILVTIPSSEVKKSARKKEEKKMRQSKKKKKNN